MKLQFDANQTFQLDFAQDETGIFKDTRGDTQADDVYDEIMKNKEQLFSLDEPLRFLT